jgi:hypothetical protein
VRSSYRRTAETQHLIRRNGRGSSAAESNAIVPREGELVAHVSRLVTAKGNRLQGEGDRCIPALMTRQDGPRRAHLYTIRKEDCDLLGRDSAVSRWGARAAMEKRYDGTGFDRKGEVFGQ